MNVQQDIAISPRGWRKSYKEILRPVLRSREALILLTLILLPVAVALLVVVAAGSTVRTLERL